MSSRLQDLLGLSDEQFLLQDSEFSKLLESLSLRNDPDYINGFDGKKHTQETKDLLRKKTLELLKDPKFRRSRSCPGSKNGMFGRDRSGENNPRFGATVSKETREKIGNANRNRPSPFKGKTKTLSEEAKAGIRAKNARDHRIRNPEGEIVIIHNLSLFCSQNDLNTMCMAHVIAGRNKSHKGWTRA